MSDNVLSAVLNDLRDQSRGAARPDGNNLALADQIQFSSLLKVMVTPPEKEIQQAQAAGKTEKSDFPEAPPEKAANQRPEAKEVEPAAQKTPPEKSDGAEPEPQKKAAFDPADAKKDVSDVAEPESQPAPQTSTNDEAATPKTDIAASVAEEAPVVKAGGAPQSTHSVPTPTEKPAATAPAGPTAPQVPVQSATANLNAALTNQGFLDGTAQPYSSAKPETDTHTGTGQNTTAATAAAAKQANALGDKLGLNSQTQQVSITVDAGTAAQAPKSTLAPSTLLAAMDPGAGGQPSLAGQSSSDGSKAGGQQKGQAANAGQSGAQNQPVQQVDAQALNQAFRAQVLSASAQAASAVNNGSAKAVTAPTEPIALNSVAGLSGPSQISQTAKATPTTAARYPQAMRSPAEQIAVQIKSGLANGVDKINIRLNPASLGRVEVKLELSHDGRIHAAITAEKPETLDLLQRDARILERALQDAGLRTGSDSLNFSLKGEGGHYSGTAGDGNAYSGAAPSAFLDMPDETPDSAISNTNEVNGRNLAAEGHVDIRI